MKRLSSIVATLAVLAGAMSLGAAPADAKLAKTTFYLHGNYPVGDGVELVGNLSDGTYPTIDKTEPTDPTPKSWNFGDPVGNDQCVGNPLFPSWQGMIKGTVKGDVTLFANFASAPASVTARIWFDVPFLSCTSSAAGTDAYQEPYREVQVTIPPGANEVPIVFKGINKRVKMNVVVELINTTPQPGRVLYDSPSAPTRLEMTCSC
ncbi:MAG TPA: hypothetical protein VFK89_07220 [Actinomycetota bacterium]|nr:hypothetical protein [Actinomycetota bacterium]